jgi:hypothetical protein
MIRSKYVFAAPVLLALALSGCGGNKKDEAVAGSYCPNPFLVQDAQSLTRFKPGTGRDPRDIAFQASITGTGVACEVSRKRLDVTLKIRVVANAGPSVGAGTTSVPYFVRLLDGSGGVADGQDFLADYKLSTANPRGASVEEITLVIPFNVPSDLGAYRVAVGLKPTPEELDYNRRAAARQ